MKVRLFVIGCTGSVGSSILSVCRAYPDKFEVTALAAKSSMEGIERLSEEFRPSRVILADKKAACAFKEKNGRKFTVLAGEEGLAETASAQDVDHVVVASSGTGAIPALMTALQHDKDVSLANKESIVVAGKWVLPLVRRRDQLRPLDSEHNALWQCLRVSDISSVSKIFLTASGGPFRNFILEDLEKVTPAMAIAHPVWNMGAKISVDSATLMNKGVEILEAMSLFSLPPEKVDTVISPDPFIHSIVEFSDGTFILAASAADMRIPCTSALFYPERSPYPMTASPALHGMNFSFQSPDEHLFPCLRLAKDAARAGGAYPPLLIGADEVAVENFLAGKIGFLDIARVVESVFDGYRGKGPRSLDDALSILEEGKRTATLVCSQLKSPPTQGD